MVRHASAHGIGFPSQGEVGLKLFADDAVQRGGLGPAASVELGMGAGRLAWRRNRPAGFPVGGLGLCGHQDSETSRTSRRTGRCVLTSMRCGSRGRRMEEAVGWDGWVNTRFIPGNREYPSMARRAGGRILHGRKGILARVSLRGFPEPSNNAPGTAHSLRESDPT